MITIEEKLKLFTKIVYDKVEKENQKVINEFNDEYGNVLEQKKNEFTTEANEMMEKSTKNIKKEKQHIISRARMEEKRMLLEKRGEIYDETIEELIKYAEKFTESNEYEKLFFRDFNAAILEVKECSNLDIYLTQKDAERFKMRISTILADKTLNFYQDDEIAGGFILVDGMYNIRIDMSYSSRIKNSRDYLGQKLVDILQ